MVESCWKRPCNTCQWDQQPSTDNQDDQFFKKEEVPTGRTVTYANFVCDYRPLKSEPYQLRLTVDGKRIEYPDGASKPAASLLK